MHPSWFFYPDRLKAMDRFIQELVKLPDVYIVSAQKTLEWMKDPTPLNQLNNFKPWSCKKRPANRNRAGRRRQRPAGWKPPVYQPSLSSQWEPTPAPRKVVQHVATQQPKQQTPAPPQQTSTRRHAIMSRLEEMQRLLKEKQRRQQMSDRRTASTNQRSLTQMMLQQREQKRREELQRQAKLKQEYERRREAKRQQQEREAQRQQREREAQKQQREREAQRQKQELLKRQKSQLQQIKQQRLLQLARQEATQKKPTRQLVVTKAKQVPSPRANVIRRTEPRPIIQPAGITRKPVVTYTHRSKSASSGSQNSPTVVIEKPVAPKTEPRTTTEDPVAKERRIQEAHLRRKNETITRQRQQQALIRQRQIAQLKKQQQALQRQMMMDVKRQRDQQMAERLALKQLSNAATDQSNVTPSVKNQTQTEAVAEAQAQTEQPEQNTAWRSFIRMILGSS